MAAVQITNYSELLAASADWLNRGDITDQIPAFVFMATAQFNRVLRLRNMMTRADAVSANEFVELPPDWLEHYSLVIPNSTNGYALRYISERESNERKARSSTGYTDSYTLIGNSIELVLAPGDDIDLTMVYYAKIPDLGLDPALQTNWLLTKAPDLYLYGTLLNAEPYIKNDDRIALWAQMRADLIESLRMESEAALRPRSGQLIARAPSF